MIIDGNDRPLNRVTNVAKTSVMNDAGTLRDSLEQFMKGSRRGELLTDHYNRLLMHCSERNGELTGSIDDTYGNGSGLALIETSDPLPEVGDNILITGSQDANINQAHNTVIEVGAGNFVVNVANLSVTALGAGGTWTKNPIPTKIGGGKTVQHSGDTLTATELNRWGSYNVFEGGNNKTITIGKFSEHDLPVGFCFEAIHTGTGTISLSVTTEDMTGMPANTVINTDGVTEYKYLRAVQVKPNEWHVFDALLAAGGGGTVQNGNLSIQPADEGTTAGNARGANAVDLQSKRSLATQVASAAESAILSGADNTVSGACALVVGGKNNINQGTNGSVIGGGIGNQIGSCFANYMVIAGGATNCLNGSGWSAIVGGNSNCIQGCVGGNGTSFIGGGANNKIRCGSTNVNIVGGNGNQICCTRETSILGGSNNCIQHSALTRANHILGGCLNTITGADCAAILSGANNAVTHNNTQIIGSGITSQAIDTTYVNNLTASSNGTLIDGSVNAGTVDSAVFIEKVTTPSSSSNVLTLDLANSNVFEVTLTENVTTLNLNNAPASGKTGNITLILKQDGVGSHTFAWPASVKWASGLVPSLTTTASAVDILTLTTSDNGTTWYGFLGGADFS
jgi:hypothetical protein